MAGQASTVNAGRMGNRRDKPINLKTNYFYGPQPYGDITGVEQDAMLPLFRENLQLGSGINPPMLDVATPCAFTPAVVVVLSIPTMYTVNGTVPTTMGMLIKDLCESHAKAVSGLDITYSLQAVDGGPVGHDGQTFKVPGKTTRSEVNPSFTFSELTGNIVWNVFKKWIWDIQHPDTNASMAQLPFPGAYTMSAYSMSMMVIQFDPTMRPDRIIDAAVFCNMYPTTTTDLGMERTIGNVKVPERSITFNAILQHNPYVKALAVELAKELKLHTHNYNIAPPNKGKVDANLMGPGMKLGLAGETEDREAWLNQSGANSAGVFNAVGQERDGRR
jgi:hypothetical protein